MDYAFLLSLLFFLAPISLLFYMGVEISLRNRTAVNRQASALFYAMALLLTGNFLTSVFPPESFTTLVVWLEFFPAFLLVSFALHLMFRLTNRYAHWPKLAVAAVCYLPMVCFIPMLLSLDTVFVEVLVKGRWVYGEPSLPALLLILAAAGYGVVLAIFMLTRAFQHVKRTNNALKKKQIQSILHATVVGGITSIVLASFNRYFIFTDTVMYPEASFFGILYFAIVIRYAMVKYEFLPSFERKYKILFEKSPSAILLMDEAGMLLESNPAAGTLFGRTPSCFSGMTLHQLLKPYAGPYGKGAEPDKLQVAVLPNGERRILRVEKEWIETGGETCQYLLLWDVTETIAAEETMTYMAYHDALTGLGNRRRFQEAMAEPGRQPLSVVLVDLDRFKQVNDTRGHHVGDLILQYVSRILLERTRDGDMLVARLGGDEFGILVRGVREQPELAELCERILEGFVAPFEYEHERYYITVSIGISMASVDVTRPEQLLQHADIAMYEAKRSGASRYVFFTSLQKSMQERRHSLEARMREALEEQRFVLHYQPQIDLRTGTVCGVEALVRWIEPDSTVIPPADFIPVAEETGLIVLLGRRVLRMACEWGRQWLDQGLPELTLSVNVSNRELVNPRWLYEVEQTLEATGFPPRLLHLEMTESMLASDEPYYQQIYSALMAKGIRLAIDDFGTGYSTFSVMQAVPFEIFKIDRSIIQDIARSAKTQNIVKAMIMMARSLNQRVIAEGVESAEQAEVLKSLECDVVQGFLYSRPLASESFHAWYFGHRRSFPELYANNKDSA